MKVLLAPGIFPPDAGGPASFAPLLATKLHQRNHEVMVVTNGEAPSGFDDQYPFPVTRIGRCDSVPAQYVRQVRTLVTELLTGDWDVVLANAFDLQTMLATRLAGTPAATKVVGDNAWERARRDHGVTDDIETFQRRSYGPKIRFLKLLRTVQTRGFDHVVTPSQYLRNIVTGWGVADEKSSVIYNAIDVEPPAVPDEDRRERIVTVGRLVPWKGIDGVIDAFDATAADWPDLELHVVGDGPERRPLEARATDTDHSDRIVFHGRVEHDRVLELVAESRIFALNSTYEGLPHVVLEAMAAGTPVVASAAGGTPEVVRDEETGLLVEQGDVEGLATAFGRLLSDAALRETLRTGATDLMTERFDHERMVDEYERLLVRVAQEAR